MNENSVNKIPDHLEFEEINCSENWKKFEKKIKKIHRKYSLFFYIFVKSTESYNLWFIPLFPTILFDSRFIQLVHLLLAMAAILFSVVIYLSYIRVNGI